MKFLATISLALLASACSAVTTVGAGSSCTSNSDCTGALVCVADVCKSGPPLNSSSSGGGGGVTTGSTGSSGGSSGSTGSSTTPASGPEFSLINAAPYYGVSRADAGIDVCVKAKSDAGFGTTGLIGGAGITYGTSSKFYTMSKVPSTLRVIAAGGDCTIGLFSPDVDFDFSQGAGFYTGVVAGDASGGHSISSMGIISGQNPASGKVNLGFANALVNEGTITDLLDPLPFTELATASISFGSTADSDVDGLNGQVLRISGNQTLYFKDYFTGGVPANTSLSIVGIGDVALTSAIPASLLVCVDGTGSDGLGATCTTVAVYPNPLAYIRAANLLDAADVAGKGAGVKVCVTAGLPSVTSPTAFTGLLAAQVSNFVAVDAGTSTAITFTTSDCSSAIGQQLLLAAGTAPGVDSYITAAVGGNASAYQTMSFVTQPTGLVNEVSLSAVNLALTTGGAHFDAAHFAFPYLFNFAFAMLNFGEYTVSPIEVTAAQFAQFSDATLAITADAARTHEIDFAFTPPPAPATSFTVLAGGTAANSYALLCSNDGSSDGGGLSACTKLATAAAPAHAVFARLANLSAADAALCVSSDAGGSYVAASDGVLHTNTVGGFVAVNKTTNKVGYAVTAAGCASGALLQSVSLNAALADGDYFTVVAATTEADVSAPALPPAPATAADDFEMIGVNGLLSNGLNAQQFGGAGLTAVNDQVVLASDSTTTGGTELKVQITPNGLSATSFVPPAVRDNGAYTAIVDLTNNPPTLLWCDNYAANDDGTSVCTLVP